MNPTVLVIDDEPHIQQAIRRLLRVDNHTVHLAGDGHRALEILACEEVGVIICDQRMPGLSGAEVLAESVKLRPDAFRIALTGYTDLAAVQASINNGRVNRFLLKPWNDDQLRETVREGMEAYRLVQDHHRLEELTRQQKAKLEAWNQQLAVQVQERTAELEAQNANLVELQEQLEKSLRDTVGVLAGILEAYSPSLGIHAKRVADLSLHLATRLEVPAEERRDIEFAGYLHDLGKISRLHHEDGFAASRSPGARKASPAVRHPDSGYAMLAQVRGFENIAWGVRYQQERYDGSGHPEGLSGDDIPLSARIIAIVNAYDEAVFPASNPTGISREAGLRVLHEGQGKRFDPRLVKAFLAYIEEFAEKPDTDVEVEVSVKQIREGMVLSRDIRNADEVLLLKRNTQLTEELIRRIRALSAVNPFLTRVFIRCTSDQVPPDEESPGHARSVGTPVAAGMVGESSHTSSEEPRSNNSYACDAKRQAGSRDSLADRPGYSCATPKSSDAGRAASIPAPGRIRCLIVDDSRFIRSALTREFHRAGFESAATDNGHEALEWVRQTDFDVAVVDLAMPSMSGSELVDHLAQCRPDLPCIIVTGNATQQDVVRLSRAGNVAGILVKPWDYERLILTVNTAIARFHRKHVQTPA